MHFKRTLKILNFYKFINNNKITKLDINNVQDTNERLICIIE